MHIRDTGLAQQLSTFRESFLARLPGDERHLFHTAEDATLAELQARSVPQVGMVAPDFALPDQHGVIVRLSDRLRQGPVVMLFVRGAWCPFCTLTLRAYQDCLPAIHEAGADLLAITPQPATTCSVMAERDLLAFETLSDQGNQVARTYGIAFETNPLVRPMYERLGHDLPRLNGTGDWTVPLPATFIIGQNGRVMLAHVQAFNHLRLDPAKIVAALREPAIVV